MWRRFAVSVMVFFPSLPLIAAQVRDIDGNEHVMSGAKATIVFFVTHDCPISNRYVPEIRRICRDYSEVGARCLMVYVDPTTGVDQIREHQETYDIAQNAVHDPGHSIVELAGASVTPEAAVFDGVGQMTYRGRIDNLYAALGIPRRRATEHNLRHALDETLTGKAVSQPRTQAVGCFIPFLSTEEAERRRRLDSHSTSSSAR